MKKISFLCILIALLVLAILPGTAFADTASGYGVNVRLINPVAVAAVGNYVFVADNVDEGQSVIHGIDISGDSPQRKYFYTTQKPVVNIAEINGDLYVMYADCVDVLSVANMQLSLKFSYADINVTDYTYNTLLGYSTALYAQGRIFYKSSEEDFPADSRTENAMSLLSATADDGNYIYFTKNENGTTSLKRIKMSVQAGALRDRYDETDKLNANGVNYGTAFSLKGMFNYTVNGVSNVALFGGSSVRTLTELSGEFSASAENEIIHSETQILDGCFCANKIALLNNEYKIDVYNYNSETSQFELQFTVGTDTISQTTPSSAELTGFTLAKSLGYPTNIAYRTADDETSIPNVLTDLSDQFIILDYDGAENSDFYYVLIGDKFAWIEKTKGAVVPENDENLQIIDTSVSGDVTYNAQFISANAVFVYQLPLSDSVCTTFSQSITNPQSALILQKFVEYKSDGTNVEWFYVAYGENNSQRGFVPCKNVGKFHVSAAEDGGMPVLGYRKINASLFEAVKLYATSAMEDNETIYNEAGEIKLYSGTHVVVVREENGASFIEIRQNDGTTTYGWVTSKYLIDMHSITTNAIVGISILSVAVLLAIIFFSVFVRRKRRRKRSASTAEEE